MAEYQLLLFDRTAAVLARHPFTFNDDAESTIIAASIWDACSDLSAGYELRSDAGCVALALLGGPVPNVDRLGLRLQALLLQCEERIRRNHHRLAKSKKLLAQIDTLRYLVNAQITTHLKPKISDPTPLKGLRQVVDHLPPVGVSRRPMGS
jgi:hypothetical protein